jgi:hypothetical protein
MVEFVDVVKFVEAKSFHLYNDPSLELCPTLDTFF